MQTSVSALLETAAGEGVFGVLKREPVFHQNYRPRDEARAICSNISGDSIIRECVVELRGVTRSFQPLLNCPQNRSRTLPLSKSGRSLPPKFNFAQIRSNDG